jgi:hypothetical protein
MHQFFYKVNILIRVLYRDAIRIFYKVGGGGIEVSKYTYITPHTIQNPPPQEGYFPRTHLHHPPEMRVGGAGERGSGAGDRRTAALWCQPEWVFQIRFAFQLGSTEY